MKNSISSSRDCRFSGVLATQQAFAEDINVNYIQVMAPLHLNQIQIQRSQLTQPIQMKKLNQKIQLTQLDQNRDCILIN